MVTRNYRICRFIIRSYSGISSLLLRISSHFATAIFWHNISGSGSRIAFSSMSAARNCLDSSIRNSLKAVLKKDLRNILLVPKINVMLNWWMEQMKSLYLLCANVNVMKNFNRLFFLFTERFGDHVRFDCVAEQFVYIFISVCCCLLTATLAVRVEKEILYFENWI